MSDDTARIIDAEVKQVIDRNYDRAKQILLDNMDVLHHERCIDEVRDHRCQADR